MTTPAQDRHLNHIRRLTAVWRDRDLSAKATLDEIHGQMEEAEKAGCTRADIARAHGVSRERVSQILGRRRAVKEGAAADG